MDQKILKKLGELDLLERLPGGKQGVRVSLQSLPRLTDASRVERRRQLVGRFEEIARRIAPDGGAVDLDSVSPSGQTVEAVLPLDCLDRLERELAEQEVRVDPLIDRQIV